MENLKLNISSSKPRFYKDQYETEAWATGSLICGVDEVGRGCLAGPVVVAAVILHPNKKSRQLKDSKLLTKEELQKAASWILKNSWHGIGIIDSHQIDTYNIYQATLMAMKRAVMQTLLSCPQEPAKILVDAMPLKLRATNYQHISIHHFPQGERKSSSIAAASIIAKVKRDSLITNLDQFFPGYHLAEHKGYATSVHCKAVRSEGHSIIHRTSFLNNVLSREIQTMIGVEEHLEHQVEEEIFSESES